ncbi:protein kinase-like protein [Aspergillus taichungensis]|uniref:Protein kinase-like protein n=1 Tax=Aspergillus taichungensis TaxID=482145 RepID=A0A2J5I4M8_9EURO|nr:protein kinase-like protein [Aspergillus taichungensis]
MVLSACQKAREEISRCSADAKSASFPVGTPVRYYPLSEIRKVFGTNECLKKVFLCQCRVCTRDSARNLGEREVSFDAADLTPYMSIYALLIWHRRAGLIQLFRSERVNLDGQTFLNDQNLLFLRDFGVEAHESIRDAILRDQYSFQVRAIEKCRHLTTIHPLEVLPIVEDDTHRGQGAFGEVFAFHIPYDEYRGKSLRDHNITRFARKIFRNRDDTDGVIEFFNLLHVDRIRHEHLMPALGAFTHGNHFFILFEEATETLGNYLQSDGRRFTPEELWNQVLGVSEGLAHLHGIGKNQFAYHRDLKPENILIVRGVMKIADFGLAQFEDRSTRTISSYPGQDPGHSEIYKAPENDDRTYTRAMDVWSLGAIISEIATFDLQKKEGIDRYRSERLKDIEEEGWGWLSSKRFHNNGRMKESVRQKHRELRDRVDQSKDSRNRAELHPFQRRFFTDSFFTLMEEMLWDRNEPCPSSMTVAACLYELYYRAAFELEDNKGPLAMDMAMAMPATLRPYGQRYPNCLLQEAYYGDQEILCGLLLWTPDRNQYTDSLLIHRWTYDPVRRWSYDVEKSYMRIGQEIPSLKPDYAVDMPRERSIQVTLIQADLRSDSYRFSNPRDALNLQAAMTDQHTYRSRLERVFSKTKVERRNAVAQLWSEGPLPDERELWPRLNWPLTPRMHVAIIQMDTNTLFLIKGQSPAYT